MVIIRQKVGNNRNGPDLVLAGKFYQILEHAKPRDTNINKLS